MALKHPRANGVQTLVSEFARWSSSPVDGPYVNRLVQCYQASRLLTDGADKADVPFGHYRDGWCQLVERVNKDTAEEDWVLLPGMEGECRDCFAEAVKDQWPRETVQTQVKGLLRRYADAQAAAARAKADSQREAEREAEEKANAARIATIRQAETAAKAEAKAEPDEAKRAELNAKGGRNGRRWPNAKRRSGRPPRKPKRGNESGHGRSGRPQTRPRPQNVPRSKPRSPGRTSRSRRNRPAPIRGRRGTCSNPPARARQRTWRACARSWSRPTMTRTACCCTCSGS